MIKVFEIKETVAESNVLQDMYTIEALNKDIIKALEGRNEINIEDYRYLNIVFEKTKIALQKVASIMSIGGENNG